MTWPGSSARAAKAMEAVHRGAFCTFARPACWRVFGERPAGTAKLSWLPHVRLSRVPQDLQ